MSGKVRVYEVAKQLNLDPKQVVGLFQAIGVVDVRNHMSSVEPEQVERIKRHLEKQRTHDVVEERVRSDGRVIKRRAIAKAPGSAQVDSPPSSAAILPTAAPSVRALDDVAGAPEPNGHPAPEPVVMREAMRDATRDRESGRLVIPEDRKSARAVDSTPSLPRDRASTRNLPVPEAPPPRVSEPRLPPVVERATDDTVAAAEPAPVMPEPVAPLAPPVPVFAAPP
ncbi:MAG: translation initiation factor IF-2 N-terminal domain-containing protein, partial [Polyangiaceae bacterium]